MLSQKSMLTVVMLASASFVSASSVIAGGSSNDKNVVAGASSIIPFGSGKAGLSFSDSNGNMSNLINLADGPIKYIHQKHSSQPINGYDVSANVDGVANPKYLMLKDINRVVAFFTNPVLGQVWYEKRANNVNVYSIRQIDTPRLPIAPKFGGLVIAEVPNLPVNTKVYFGEWAPRANSPSKASSTDLNMASEQRTVWYVGENPTRQMPTLVNAKYDVLGVNQHTPGINDFYTGVLTVNFGSEKGSISGVLSRGYDTLDFAGTGINKEGAFSKGENISGRFYGDRAEALAGYAKRGDGAADDIAFGGVRR